MRKIYLALFLTFTSLVFIINNPAKTYADTLKGQRLVCLQATLCDKPGAGCFTGKDGHTVSLKSIASSPSKSNWNTYIVECVSTSGGQVCTTGNADQVTDINWKTSLTDLEGRTGYKFHGLFDIGKNTIDQAVKPVETDVDGMIPAVEWKSSTSQATDHSFYALNILDNTSYVTDGYNESQKQATFELMFEDDSDCTSLRWDPYGIVFDSKSLEPIPGASVTLYEKVGGAYSGPAHIAGVNNPVTTLADGVFNFVVPDGTYKLDASASNYASLPTSVADINRSYLNIYSNVYLGDSTNLDIVQKDGVPQLRNIPLVPKAGHIGSYPVKVMNYTQTVDKNNGVYSIKGTVSHPFSDIKVYTNLVNTTTFARYIPLDFKADKNGAFSISIKISLLEKGEVIGGIEATKKNFSQPQINYLPKSIFVSLMNIFIKPVSAQSSDSTRMAIPPILNNIDGYAYDDSGIVLPNTKIGVYVQFSDQLVYETTTDSTGHFTVDSTKLPPIPYILRYTAKSGKSIEVTTDKYLKDNSAYIQRTNQNPNDTHVFPTGTTAIPSVTVPVQSPAPQEQASNTGNGLVIAVVILIVIVIIAAGAVYFLRKPKQQI